MTLDTLDNGTNQIKNIYTSLDVSRSTQPMCVRNDKGGCDRAYQGGRRRSRD